jgi:hypothetical protein
MMRWLNPQQPPDPPAPRWQTRPLTDAGIPHALAAKLANEGIRTLADAAAAADETLLAVSGFGAGRLETLR